MAAVVFFVCAAAVLIGALGVITGRNPVHSALFLLLTLVSIAVLYLQQHAQLVAAIQIVVYASAIVVLFLFVITLLGVDKHEAPDDAHPLQRVAAITLGVLLFTGIIVLVHGNDWVTGAHSTRGALGVPAAGNVETLAKSLFTSFVWAFEMTAVLLVIAVVGSVVLAPQRPPAGVPRRRRRRRGRTGIGAGDPVSALAYPDRITPTYYLILAAGLFTIGAVGLLIRKNTLVMFMCIELMLNAANLTFVSFASALNDISGQVIVFFTLVVAAAEVAVGLAIIIAIFRRRQSVNADDVDLLKG